MKDTLKNADIYLNNKLVQHTDQTGMAIIDLYKEVGNYYLKMSNKNDRIMGYFFLLDRDLKLSCSGKKLNYQKKEY